MADLICADCGTTNTGRAEFCSSCGAFLAWDGVPDEPAPPVAPVAPVAPAPGPSSPPSRPPMPQPTGMPAPTPNRPPAQPPPPGGADGFGYTIMAPPGRTVSLPPAGPDPVWPGPGQQFGPGAVATAPPPGSCTRCGTDNPPERRFCAKCGLQLFTPDPRTTPKVVASKPIKRPWWQRWIPRSWLPDQEFVNSAARRAFRRSLPTGIRLRRGAGIIGVLALIVGIFYIAGTNPVRWVKDRIEDMSGSLADVTGLQVASEPVDAQVIGYPVDYVTDNAETAWATPWKPVPAGTCLPPGSAAPAGTMGSLLLVLPGPTKVRGLEIAAGLPASDQRRPHQYRPKTLELTFADGKCITIGVADDPGLQRIQFDPVTTDQIRVAFVDGYAPVPDSKMDLVAISEIRVLARP